MFAGIGIETPVATERCGRACVCPPLLVAWLLQRMCASARAGWDGLRHAATVYAAAVHLQRGENQL